MSVVLMIVVAAVAVLAWLLIPAQGSKGPKDPPSAPGWIPAGSQPIPPMGPFAASVEEKMSVVENELRQRQAEKYRKQVIDEVAELVGANSSGKTSSK